MKNTPTTRINEEGDVLPNYGSAGNKPIYPKYDEERDLAVLHPGVRQVGQSAIDSAKNCC